MTRSKMDMIGAMLTELKTESCKHFGTCGGCTCRAVEADIWAPPPYEEQVAAKETRVKQLLSPFGIADWRPTVPSPEIWHYRNKMEFAFGLKTWKERELVLGLRQARSFDRVVDVETCRLISPESMVLLEKVRTWAKHAGLSGYDRGRHNGDVRYLVVREGKNTGQRMAFLIASAEAQDRILPHLESLMTETRPLLTTLWAGFTDCRSDVARAEKMQLLWGAGHIQERLNDLVYRISPYSFFQTNTRGTERLYGLLRDWAKEDSGGALMDLYCGSGGITLSIASCFDRAVGVDINAEAIEDAKYNAEQNNSQNVEFVASDTENFLKILPATKLAVQLSAAIVDPPRPGLQPKALQAVLDLNPRRLAYVSCNPESLARDLQNLVPYYTPRSAQVIDLFPHTPHVETLVTLEHR
jgi:23S rRNA (uracil1939-C5)-methyltransferase